MHGTASPACDNQFGKKMFSDKLTVIRNIDAPNIILETQYKNDVSSIHPECLGVVIHPNFYNINMSYLGIGPLNLMKWSDVPIPDKDIKLKAGSLPIPLELVENKVIGPTLGADSISKSWKAGLLGFLFVSIFMIAYYRVPGLISIVALLIYAVLDFAILSAMGATLTLPGIAGFILTIGMAVDANVLIFERVKEVIRRGRNYVEAIPYGFDRAFSSIVDSNVTTIIGAVVLFWLGTGTIKGFAITLITGILVSMFSAIVLTRFMMDLTKNAKIFNNHFMVKR